MDTLTFLQTILPEEGFKFVGLSRAGNKGIAHKAYESLEVMAKAIASYNAQPNLTVYHACCAYKAPSYETSVNGESKTKYRGEQNWFKAKSFWADIDCGQSKHDEGKGYLTKTDAAKAILRFCHANQFPAPMFVDSGGGIHCYWPLTRSIGPKSWRQMAHVLKSVFQAAGLLVDPTRTADLSSVLRPVGSTNRKANRPEKEVKVLKETTAIDPQDFSVALNKLQQKYNAPSFQDLRQHESSGLNDDLLAHLGPNIECSAEEVANHCLQVGKMRDTRGDVDYETWRGVVGIIKHCVEGYDTAVEWSSQRAATNHAQTDTLTRYESWDAGPATCEFFKKCNPNGCAGCVHDGKVKSPIVLGRIVPEPQEEVVQVLTEEAEEIETTIPKLPEGYEFNARMIRYIKDKDGINQPYSFSQTLFYPIQRIRKSDGSFAFTIRMHLPDKRIRDFEVDTASLASSSDMLKALSKYELMPTNNKDATMHMTAYIRDSVHKLMVEQRETDTLTSFGWRNDMSGFLLGDRLYHTDGSIRKVFIGGNAANHKDAYPMPRGTLAEYTKAVNLLYNRENSEAAQYVFCNVYGSLLTPFGEDSYNGALVAINSGASGKGKTSVWRAALYGLADATKLIYAGKEGATRNARWTLVGTHKNIPIVFDEMTNVEPEELSTFAYTVSQGTDRARLTSQGGKVSMAEQHTWKAVVGLTANEDMHSKLAAHNANTQAEAVRMIGINFSDYGVPIIDPSTIASDAIDAMRENLGNAGDIYVRYIVTHQKEIADQFAKTQNKLAVLLPEAEYRFFRSHATCTLVAAKILIDLGIVEFNYELLWNFTVKMLTNLTNIVTTNNMTNPNDAISRMIRELSQRVLVTYEYRDLRTDSRGPEDVISRPIGSVVGRRILGSNNYKDSKYVGRLFIAKKEFVDWCAKNRMEPKSLLDYAQSQKWLVPWADKFNMGRGTAHSTGSCSCYVLDYSAMEGAVEKTSGPAASNVKDIVVASNG